jgi:predicted O-methyltransferase YrrM
MIDVFTASRRKTNLAATLAAFGRLEIDPVWTAAVIENLNSQADIRAILHYLAAKTKPATYLEIGVRRGFSMAMVASAAPDCNVFGFDAWVPVYANVDNPGPVFVASEINKFNRSGGLTFVDGNSRETLPRFFATNPDLQPDLILIDGDHSAAGALADVQNCLPRLAPGGYLIVDDIAGGVETVWDAMPRDYPAYAYSREGIVGVVHYGN